MIETILGWFGPLFSGTLGYVVVTLAVALDRGAFVGLVVPGDVVLALGGIYAGRGHLSPTTVMILGAAAGVGGEILSYALGRRFGKEIVRRLPFSDRLGGYLERAEAYFAEGGRRAIFIGRYVSILGTFIPFTAGMSGMPVGRFLLVDVPVVALWSAAVTTLGYVLNAQVGLVDGLVSRFTWGALAVVVLLVGGRALWRRRARLRAWTARRSESER